MAEFYFLFQKIKLRPKLCYKFFLLNIKIMELKIKGDISQDNYIRVMDVLFQYINIDFKKYNKDKEKDTTIIYRLDYSKIENLKHIKNLMIYCHKTKTQWVAVCHEFNK